MQTIEMHGEARFTVPWGVHTDDLMRFREFVTTLRFCHPWKGTASEALPLVVTSSHNPEVIHGPQRWSVWRAKLYQDLRWKAHDDPGFVRSDGKIGCGSFVLSEFEDLIDGLKARWLPEATDPMGDSREGTTAATVDGVATSLSHIHRLVRDLNLVLFTLMTTGSAPSLGWSYYQAMLRGYVPLRWMGTWPAGHFLVYCPDGLPHATVPPDCVPTRDQLAAGKAKPAAKPPQPPPAPVRAPLPEVPAASWPALCASKDMSWTFSRHFGRLTTTYAERSLLHRISREVGGMTVEGDELVVSFTDQVTTADDGVTYTTPRRLRCAAPYAGPLPHLPESVEEVLRLHNGMAGDGALEWARWHVFDGKHFASTWEWAADPEDPEELFADPPQVPLSDGSDLWLLHPRLTTASGEPALVWMSHETAALGPPLAMTAGGAFLRLLALSLGVVSGVDLLQELRGRSAVKRR